MQRSSPPRMCALALIQELSVNVNVKQEKAAEEGRCNDNTHKQQSVFLGCFFFFLYF